MITYDIFLKNIKNKELKKTYIFCGIDEELIKDAIKIATKPFIQNELSELNFINIDGLNASFDSIMNASETMPFMSEKKVVVVYRANFLREKSDSSQTKLFNEIKEYIKDIPPYTILIMYYIFSDKRETPKKNKKLMTLEGTAEIVYIEKLRYNGFIKKVQEMFNESNITIKKSELNYFCDKVPNDFQVIKNEIEKLELYTKGREIKKEDIDKLLPRKSEEDVFDLVDLISQGKIEKAINIMDDMLFKADQHMIIIISIQNQFKKLYNIKILLNEGKKIEDLVKVLKIPPFICEKLTNLSRRFSIKQLEEIIKLCAECEGMLKSTSVDKRAELEFLLIKTLMVKK